MDDLNSIKLELKQKYLVNAIISGAFTAASVIYVVMGELVLRKDKPEFEAVNNNRHFFILLISAITVISGLVVFLAKKKLMADVENRNLTARNPQQGGFSITFFGRLTLANLIQMAWCESISIYGLVGFFFGFTSYDSYIATGISLVMFAIFFPRYSKWEEYVTSNISQFSNQSSMGKTAF